MRLRRKLYKIEELNGVPIYARTIDGEHNQCLLPKEATSDTQSKEINIEDTEKTLKKLEF